MVQPKAVLTVWCASDELGGIRHWIRAFRAVARQQPQKTTAPSGTAWLSESSLPDRSVHSKSYFSTKKD
jgi:hypothetical protein